jgi:hypothetical protein
MKNKTKFLAGATVVVLAAVLVVAGLQGGSDQLQGRFSNMLSGRDSAIDQPQTDVDFSIEFAAEADEHMAKAEMAYDTAYNAYLIATIPGLKEEGPEDYQDQVDVIDDQHQELVNAMWAIRNLVLSYNNTLEPPTGPAQLSLWNERLSGMAEQELEAERLLTEVEEWLEELE